MLTRCIALHSVILSMFAIPYSRRRMHHPHTPQTVGQHHPHRSEPLASSIISTRLFEHRDTEGIDYPILMRANLR